MQLFQRFLIAVLLLGLGCAAQANSPEVNQRIERQVRVYLGDKIPPSVNISVGPRTPNADFPGYDKVIVTLSQGGRKQDLDFLLSRDGTHLVRVTRFDLTTDPYAEVMKKIDLSGRPVRGNRNAKVTIVNFDDFQCPFCARMHADLMQNVLKTYGDRVRIIYKDFPLTEIHPWAVHAAVDANCLAAQSNDAYWDFADFVHAHQKEITGNELKPPFAPQFAALDRTATDMAKRYNLQLTPLQACLQAQTQTAVAGSLKEGLGLGLDATPTLFINGEKVAGAVPFTELQAIINRALQEAGEPVPAAAAATTTAPTANVPPAASVAPQANSAANAPAASAAPAGKAASPPK